MRSLIQIDLARTPAQERPQLISQRRADPETGRSHVLRYGQGGRDCAMSPRRRGLIPLVPAGCV